MSDSDSLPVDSPNGNKSLLTTWFPKIFRDQPTTPKIAENGIVSSETSQADDALRVINSEPSVSNSSSTIVLDAVRGAAVNSIITAVRQVSNERDRDEVLRWLIQAHTILTEEPVITQSAGKIYQTIDSIRLAQLLVNTIATTANNYVGAQLPLALKVALPITALGALVFGAQGVGIAGFGTAVGAPVVLILFLGTVGVASILEAFLADPSVRDPLTRLLLAFVELEAKRRARKELMAAMRADAMVPKEVPLSTEGEELLNDLRMMDPVEFERHIMSFFAKAGHPTGMTPRSNDFGVDGYVVHPDGLIVVQCKRYAVDNPVGRPVIQQFKGVIEEQQAFRGYVVTTSRYTAEARESANGSTRIRLVDADDLLAWHKGDLRDL